MLFSSTPSRIGIVASCVCVGLLISGCSPQDEKTDASVIKFQGKTDSSRQYVGSAIFSVSGQSITFDHILSYKVLNRADPMKLQAKLSYLHLDTGSSVMPSVSSTYVERKRAMFGKLMDAGITMSVESKASKIVAISSEDDDIKSFLDDSSLMGSQQKDLFQVSGILAAIPAKVGASVDISVRNIHAKATLTRLTAHYATILIKATVPKEQLDDSDLPSWIAMTMVVERKSGWLVSSARLGTLIKKGNQPAVGFDEQLYQSNAFGPFSPIDVAQPPIAHTYHVKPPQAQPKTSDELFASNYGLFINSDTEHKLTYPLKGQWAQQIALSDFEPMNQTVQQQLKYTYQMTGHGNQLGVTGFSHGWKESNRRYSGLVRWYKASAKFYPVSYKALSLKVNPAQKTQLNSGDLTAQLVPVKGHEGRFNLFLYRSVNSWFNFANIPQLEGAKVRALAINHQFDDIAQLTHYGSARLNRGELRATYEIQWPQGKALPQKLTLQQVTRAKDAAFEKELEFRQPRDLALNMDISPRDDNWQIPAAKSSLTSGPEIENRNQLAFYWDASDIQRCQLSVKTPQLNGHVLSWQLDSSEGTSQRWLLATEHKRHSYFYARQVNTTLNCPTTLHWQTQPVKTASHPWLIDIRQFSKVDLNQPFEKFANHYRFYDKAGQLLSIYNLKVGYEDGDAKTLGEALLKQHYLKLSGDVASMQHATEINQSITRSWTNTLPGLPK